MRGSRSDVFLIVCEKGILNSTFFFNFKLQWNMHKFENVISRQFDSERALVKFES